MASGRLHAGAVARTHFSRPFSLPGSHSRPSHGTPGRPAQAAPGGLRRALRAGLLATRAVPG
eukprot:4448704-Alexandrium_andersonii.AAC.1